MKDILKDCAIFFPLFFAVLFLVSGCQTAGAAIDAAGGIRHNIAKKETELAVKGLCGSNFDVIRDMFGKNDQDWNAILTICESNQNSVRREP